MIKSLFVLILFPAILIAQTKTVTIDIHLSQMPDNLLFYLSDGQNNLDSALSKNENLSFTYNKSLTESQNLVFISKNKRYFSAFWIDNLDMKIYGSFNNLQNLQAQGSVTNNEFNEMQKLIGEDENSLATLSLQLEEHQTKILPDTIRYKLQIAGLSEKLAAKKIGFINLHPNSVISTRLLAMETRKKNLSNKESLKLFAALSLEQQMSATGQSILKSVNLYASPKLGDVAPLFVMSSIEDKLINLADFKGHPILLLFWATWCAPCLTEMPAIKNLYEKYKAKGLIIVAVSMDSKKES